MASAIRRAGPQVLLASGPTSDPSSDPTSSSSVGRPVSLPRALQNGRLPARPAAPAAARPAAWPGPPRRPAATEPGAELLERVQPAQVGEALAAAVQVSRPLFLSIPSFSSHTARGVSLPWRTSERLKADSASYRVRPAAASSSRSRSSPFGISPSSVATPWAIFCSCGLSGRSCSTTTNSFSSSTGICTTGERITTNVRFCLPAWIWWARACTISVLCRKRWKLGSTSRAEPSGVARPLTLLMAATGSVALAAAAAAGRRPARSPAGRGRRPSVANAHLRSRHRRAISDRASGCSWLWTQMPVNAAATYSASRCDSDMGASSVSGEWGGGKEGLPAAGQPKSPRVREPLRRTLRWMRSGAPRGQPRCLACSATPCGW